MPRVPDSPSSVRRSAVDQYSGEWQVSPPPSGGNVHKLVLKDNDAFVVCDERGDFSSASSELGYYYKSTSPSTRSGSSSTSRTGASGSSARGECR
jgi:hypothetical protein